MDTVNEPINGDSLSTVVKKVLKASISNKGKYPTVTRSEKVKEFRA